MSKMNLTDMTSRYGAKHARIFASRGYYEDTPEEIERARLFHERDEANKERIRNQRNG